MFIPLRSSTLNLAWPQLFIPSVLIYGLSDSIPFHLQSSGPAAILKGMIQPLFAESKTQHPVRVHITRRVSLLVRGERQHRNIDIGEGVLSILPPPCYSELLDPRDASVDWAGVIQCNDITATGTFDSGILYVKVSFLSYPGQPLYLCNRTSSSSQYRRGDWNTNSKFSW